MTATVEESPLSHFSFPRTGKRGVPQQFPRRLYEMLESETNEIENSSSHPKVITWSDSGKAFRIHDAAAFADSILPKYFRTKKFSSFQRNLNLYGFAKVRRGPDTDMYAHPSFLRDQPKYLVRLRKISTASRARSSSSSSSSSMVSKSSTTRAVSPSLAGSAPPSPHTLLPENSRAMDTFCQRQSSYLALPLAPKTMTPLTRVESGDSNCGYADRGKLDLLALAIEQEFSFCK